MLVDTAEQFTYSVVAYKDLLGHISFMPAHAVFCSYLLHEGHFYQERDKTTPIPSVILTTTQKNYRTLQLSLDLRASSCNRVFTKVNIAISERLRQQNQQIQLSEAKQSSRPTEWVTKNLVHIRISTNKEDTRGATMHVTTIA